MAGGQHNVFLKLFEDQGNKSSHRKTQHSNHQDHTHRSAAHHHLSSVMDGYDDDYEDEEEDLKRGQESSCQTGKEEPDSVEDSKERR